MSIPKLLNVAEGKDTPALLKTVWGLLGGNMLEPSWNQEQGFSDDTIKQLRRTIRLTRKIGPCKIGIMSEFQRNQVLAAAFLTLCSPEKYSILKEIFGRSPNMGQSQTGKIQGEGYRNFEPYNNFEDLVIHYFKYYFIII